MQTYSLKIANTFVCIQSMEQTSNSTSFDFEKAPGDLRPLLSQLRNKSIAVFGDLCLDAYWRVADTPEELSLETGLPVRHIAQQRYSPGGGANVAANLRALGVTEVAAIGLRGDDLFGEKLEMLLKNAGVDTTSLLVAKENWDTVVFAKPLLQERELNRMDFGTLNPVPETWQKPLMEALEKAAGKASAVVINQQLPHSIVNPKTIPVINALIKRHPHVVFVVDSRDYAGLFENAAVKINAHEAACLAGEHYSPLETVPIEKIKSCALKIAQKNCKPAFVTRGERGLLVAQGESLIEIQGIQILEKTDPVGAGDTVVSALAAALSADADAYTAGWLANLAASVTVRKINVTGTAQPEEILEAAASPDLVYRPEIAENPRIGRYLENSEIEILERWDTAAPLRHAVFDHDGTISTLRQGWEDIMEPMMIKAILGEQLKSAPQEVYEKVKADVCAYIDKTTGIQTLVQMKGLIGLVRQHGFVPEDEILDEHGYKAVYNEALMACVRQRRAKIERGELSPEDFAIKGAHAFLQTLYDAGVTLYLASGTDEQDVRDEAQAMGYAHLFGNRIYGACGNIHKEAKRIVMERILRESGAHGAELLVVGDGPVELREGRKRSARALGIASDEIRRYGLNLTKRKRVIRAGAHYVIPDYSQQARLLEILGIKR